MAPRDGSGVYSTLAGTDGIPDRTIESARYNANVHDVEADLNAPRPIVAGGTGATNARDALINLGGELALQQVTNYDATTFVNGSFWSSAATSSPVTGGNYVGSVVVHQDTNYTILHAYDIFDGTEYVRQRTGGTWGAWTGPKFAGSISIKVGPDTNFVVTSAAPGAIEVLAINDAANAFKILNIDGNPLKLNTQSLLPVTIGGITNLTDTTDSTLPTNGALTLAGGLGISKSANLGGTLVVQGGYVGLPVSGNNFVRAPSLGGILNLGADSTVLLAAGAGGTTTQATISTGGVAVDNTAASISFSTGSLKVAGGLGVAGAVHIGSGINLGLGGGIATGLYADGTSVAVRTYAGAAKLFFQNATGATTFGDWDTTRLNIANTTAATSATTGALLIAGGLGAAGAIFSGGTVQGTALTASNGSIATNALAGGNCALYFYDELAAQRGYIAWLRASQSINISNPAAGTELVLDFNGKVTLGKSYAGRAGTAGAYDSNGHNFYWTSTVLEAWLDNVNIGSVSLTCDYRTKKDIAPLNSTWNAVKTLRPITYTQREYTPPGADKPLFVNDDTWQWGFVAHELQDTLLPSAASGAKDSPTDIQSPNLLAIVAALTRALQEAQARIEALEARR